MYPHLPPLGSFLHPFPPTRGRRWRGSKSCSEPGVRGRVACVTNRGDVHVCKTHHGKRKLFRIPAAVRQVPSWGFRHASHTHVRPSLVVYSPNDELILVSDDLGNVDAFSSEEGTALARWRIHDSLLGSEIVERWGSTSMVTSPSGNFILSACNKQVKLWNPEDGKIVEGGYTGLCDCVWSEDSDNEGTKCAMLYDESFVLAFTHEDDVLCAWRRHEYHSPDIIHLPLDVYSIASSQSRTMIGSGDGRIAELDTLGGATVGVVGPSSCQSIITSSSLSLDCYFVVTCDRRGRVVLYDLSHSTGAPTRRRRRRRRS